MAGEIEGEGGGQSGEPDEGGDQSPEEARHCTGKTAARDRRQGPRSGGVPVPLEQQQQQGRMQLDEEAARVLGDALV